MSIFEMFMLFCFGAAWPASIYRSYVSKSIEGKSLLFMIVIATGYVFGIIHKVVFSLDFVIILYILNLLMVLTDISLYYRNFKLHNKF
ncbi:MAG: hypothetical protein K9L74_04870 [Candidatus Izimaplasma sp.]|nr:hypothetical protein [Candidatus Izimaplasma bacterium]